MARKAEDVYRDALALDEEEHQRLLKMLNATPYGGFATSELEQYWAGESERRMDELERGDVKPIPLEEVLREARARLSRS
ncbi:MAG: addiction module antitoxin RelB [Gammaproteobacteria bacterium]|nr:MAG: addiction module antitoxin RelB [Gammaproteobacteria bacterium]